MCPKFLRIARKYILKTTFILMLMQILILSFQTYISLKQKDISRATMLVPFQEKALWEWLKATEEAEFLLQEYIDGTFNSKKDFIESLKETIAKLTYKSIFASALFEDDISEKIDELAPPKCGVTDNLFVRLQGFITQALKMYDNHINEKSFTQGYGPSYIKLEIGRIRSEVAGLIKENSKK